ncbi:MAG TPA: CocE/NonD family hydrolase [Candidatus Binatia bacterium]|nr:CocE/NonD family hydrolase [Candidatus Binatia bacterium]
MHEVRRALDALIVVVLAALPANAAVVTSVFDGRVPCVVQAGVQFCPGTVLTRVESWDGVPLDVNVTLPPAAMDGPFPLIVDLHGWGVGKSPDPFVQRALAGYAVLSYSARGFHQSCGVPASRVPDPTLSDPDACAERGWIRLADARYEGRDTQHLAGLLADEALVVPDRIGVTGMSYGGGQSMILGALRDRVMLPDGTLVPWQSPGGLPMRIAAAAPLIPWSDLAYALTPNGRTLDYRALNPYGERAGVMKKSWVDALFAVGITTGFYAPTGADPDADLVAWKARLDQGEPYDTDPLLRHVLDEVTSHHSAYYVDDSVPPAPLFIYNAWTDDLFPADEALRFYLKTRSRHPGAEIALQFADAFGHPRANLGGDRTRIDQRVDELFARHLKGVGGPLPPLETFTQGCAGSSMMGAFTAPDWESIHPGEVRFGDGTPRVFDSAGGNPANAQAVNPLGPGSCRTVLSTDDPGAATYRLPAATGAGYTLMGSPTVIAELRVDGRFAQVAARLWDVGPGGQQALVSHTFYRPRTDDLGPQVFQLHPNGWHFAAGHVPKLELLGQSAPFGRPSNGSFTITVSDLELRLPVLETPDGGTIATPAPPVLPPSDVEPAECAPAPVAGCRSGGGRLVIRNDADDRRDRLVWKWGRGPAIGTDDLGSPESITDYLLCLYDGAGRRIGGGGAPHGGVCAGASCWQRTRKGLRYRDPELTPDGVARLDVRTGAADAARIALRGKGTRLDVPALPVGSYPITAQLVNSDGVCWANAFAAATHDGGGRLSARTP